VENAWVGRRLDLERRDGVKRGREARQSRFGIMFDIVYAIVLGLVNVAILMFKMMSSS
jgi:hypothetical protein